MARFDIVSQGTAPQHALTMIREAVTLSLEDDIENGRNPIDRERAPFEEWAPLLRLFEKHSTVAVGHMDASSFREFALRISVVVERTRGTGSVIPEPTSPHDAVAA